jgi:hypothetical protein
MKPLSATNNGTLNLEVVGTFQDILHFLENLNHSNILMVIGNIKLEGYSPKIKATFPVTPYLLAAGPGVKITATSGGGGGAEGGPGGAVGPNNNPETPPAGPAEKTDKKESTLVAKVKNPRMQADLAHAP